jgi:hypothetical protein
MFTGIARRSSPLLAVAAVGACAFAIPTLSASAHVPCGKHKPRHTNCGKHLGQLKHHRGPTGPSGPTGLTGPTGSTGSTGAVEPSDNDAGRHRGRGHDAADTRSAHAAKKAKHVPCGKTKPKRTNCGKHKGAGKGKKKGHSK